MTWRHWQPILIWTIAWGVTGAALYLSGVFNSPRTGPLWIALAGGAMAWSLAGALSFSKERIAANLVNWAIAYLISFALAGLSTKVFPNTMPNLVVMFIGWSAGAAAGAFASTWLGSNHSVMRRSVNTAGVWMVGYFLGSGISLTISSLTAELAKIFIGFMIGVPAALVLGFGIGCAFGGFIASGIIFTLGYSR